MKKRNKLYIVLLDHFKGEVRCYVADLDKDGDEVDDIMVADWLFANDKGYRSAWQCSHFMWSYKPIGVKLC